MLNELQSVDNNVTKVGEVQSRTLRPERRRGRGGGLGRASNLLRCYRSTRAGDSRHLLAGQSTPVCEFVDVPSGARQPFVR